MRWGANIVIMRYGPPIGRPWAPWRTHAAGFYGTLADALRDIPSRRADGAGVYWIIRRGYPAHRPPIRTQYAASLSDPRRV